MAKKKSKEPNQSSEGEKIEETKQIEQSIWKVMINSQILYKKAVDGRTILLGMTQEDNKKVAEVMDNAIDELVRVLDDKTTMHEAVEEKEQVTRVDPAIQENENINQQTTEDDSEEIVQAVQPQKMRETPEETDADVKPEEDLEEKKTEKKDNSEGSSNKKNFWDKIK